MVDDATRDLGVGGWIDRHVRLAPDRIAVIAGGSPMTYAAFAARIRSTAAGLRALGVRRGDRVAWLGPNHPAFLEAFFAAARLGAVLAPVNHRLDPAVIAAVLADTEPVVLIAHDGAGLPGGRSIRHRIAVGAAVGDDIPYETLVHTAPDDTGAVAVASDDLVFLPHTSGTTGAPKGVMLSHGNVTWNVVNLLSVADIRSDDVTIAIAPFFRVGGTGVNVLPTLFRGGTVVVPSDPSPEGILADLERHRVTVGFGNPDLLDALLRSDRWSGTDLSRVRFVITGGAPVPQRLIRAWLERGVLLQQGYGLSEAAPFALLLDPERALRKIGAAGRAPRFVDVRITDADGDDVPTGHTGELLIRGPNVMQGYWRRVDATRAALTDDGWLRTGDAARMDAEGDVWIVDRFEARYLVADEVVYPGDVERVLHEHPDVADAGVVGVAGPDGSVAGVAFIVRRPGTATTADDLAAFARDRLTDGQRPVSIRFVESLPRNAVGKLVRADLARLA